MYLNNSSRDGTFHGVKSIEDLNRVLGSCLFSSPQGESSLLLLSIIDYAPSVAEFPAYFEVMRRWIQQNKPNLFVQRFCEAGESELLDFFSLSIVRDNFFLYYLITERCSAEINKHYQEKEGYHLRYSSMKLFVNLHERNVSLSKMDASFLSHCFDSLSQPVSFKPKYEIAELKCDFSAILIEALLYDEWPDTLPDLTPTYSDCIQALLSGVRFGQSVRLIPAVALRREIEERLIRLFSKVNFDACCEVENSDEYSLLDITRALGMDELSQLLEEKNFAASRKKADDIRLLESLRIFTGSDFEAAEIIEKIQVYLEGVLREQGELASQKKRYDFLLLCLVYNRTRIFSSLIQTCRVANVPAYSRTLMGSLIERYVSHEMKREDFFIYLEAIQKNASRVNQVNLHYHCLSLIRAWSPSESTFNDLERFIRVTEFDSKQISTENYQLLRVFLSVMGRSVDHNIKNFFSTLQMLEHPESVQDFYEILRYILTNPHPFFCEWLLALKKRPDVVAQRIAGTDLLDLILNAKSHAELISLLFKKVICNIENLSSEKFAEAYSSRLLLTQFTDKSFAIISSDFLKFIKQFQPKTKVAFLNFITVLCKFVLYPQFNPNVRNDLGETLLHRLARSVKDFSLIIEKGSAIQFVAQSIIRNENFYFQNMDGKESCIFDYLAVFNLALSDHLNFIEKSQGLIYFQLFFSLCKLNNLAALEVWSDQGKSRDFSSCAMMISSYLKCLPDRSLSDPQLIRLIEVLSQIPDFDFSLRLQGGLPLIHFCFSRKLPAALAEKLASLDCARHLMNKAKQYPFQLSLENAWLAQALLLLREASDDALRVAAKYLHENQVIILKKLKSNSLFIPNEAEQKPLTFRGFGDFLLSRAQAGSVLQFEFFLYFSRREEALSAFKPEELSHRETLFHFLKTYPDSLSTFQRLLETLSIEVLSNFDRSLRDKVLKNKIATLIKKMTPLPIAESPISDRSSVLPSSLELPVKVAPLPVFQYSLDDLYAAILRADIRMLRDCLEPHLLEWGQKIENKRLYEAYMKASDIIGNARQGTLSETREWVIEHFPFLLQDSILSHACLMDLIQEGNTPAFHFCFNSYDFNLASSEMKTIWEALIQATVKQRPIGPSGLNTFLASCSDEQTIVEVYEKYFESLSEQDRKHVGFDLLKRRYASAKAKMAQEASMSSPPLPPPVFIFPVRPVLAPWFFGAAGAPLRPFQALSLPAPDGEEAEQPAFCRQ